MEQFIPYRNTKTKESSSWIDNRLRKMINRRNRAFKASKKTGKPQYEEKFRKLKREVQYELRRAYWNHIENIVTPNENDTNSFSCMKIFWKFIKHQKTDYTGITSLKVNGKLTTDSKQKANALNSHFHSVFTSETEFQIPTKRLAPAMEDITISTSGVLNLLRELDVSKAMGPDDLSPRVLKELAEVLAEPVTTIYRKSLELEAVPNDWINARVVPTYKKGQRYDCANYRPISLTCILCKVMEDIVVSHIMKHTQMNNILYHFQHGFRNKRSCETQLLEFIDDVAKNMDNGVQTDLCILDFAKAFDKVGHKRLLEKLKWYGIDGVTNRWIEQLLTGRTQSVVLDGISSDSASVLSGVPQGSVLGPCLFLLYINDIAENLQGTVRLFADDTMIYMVIRSETDAINFQKDLDMLCEWEKTWMMEFHPDKCEIISITRKRSPIHHPYKLHGKSLKHVECTKYLGIKIAKDLRWNNHIEYVTAKATNSLNFLRRNIQIGNSKIKSIAYQTLVRPQLEYCQTVWDPYTQELKNKLEMVQRRAARFTLSNYSPTSSVNSMLEKLQWKSLEHRRKIARLVMFHKISNNSVATPMTLKLNKHTHSQNSQTYVVPYARNDYYKMSFFPRTAREWNGLPNDTVLIKTKDQFKEALTR